MKAELPARKSVRRWKARPGVVTVRVGGKAVRWLPPGATPQMIERAKWSYKSHQLPPHKWRERVMKIEPRKVRVQTACYIYWDFFAGRMYGERWPHLDDLVAQYNREDESVPIKQQVKALVKCGYPLEVAKYRTRKIRSQNWYRLGKRDEDE